MSDSAAVDAACTRRGVPPGLLSARARRALPAPPRARGRPRGRRLAIVSDGGGSAVDRGRPRERPQGLELPSPLGAARGGPRTSYCRRPGRRRTRSTSRARVSRTCARTSACRGCCWSRARSTRCSSPAHRRLQRDVGGAAGAGDRGRAGARAGLGRERARGCRPDDVLAGEPTQALRDGGVPVYRDARGRPLGARSICAGRPASRPRSRTASRLYRLPRAAAGRRPGLPRGAGPARRSRRHPFSGRRSTFEDAVGKQSRPARRARLPGRL